MSSGCCPATQGTVVHDALSVYDGLDYRTASHALCGAHLLRELTVVAEDHPEQVWPGQARAALAALAAMLAPPPHKA